MSSQTNELADAKSLAEYALHLIVQHWMHVHALPPQTAETMLGLCMPACLPMTCVRHSSSSLAAAV